MKLQDFLSKKSKPTNTNAGDWLSFCTLDVTTGSLWSGDPHVPNAGDGYVAKVPRGRYAVEGIGLADGRYRFVSRLRVRLEGVENPTVGKKLGETGTDSAMIGVCDIKAFEKACAGGSPDEVQAAIEAQTEYGYGVINLKQFPGAVMPFVPTGSDGTGPVLALMSGGKCVGIEMPFTGEDQPENDSVSDPISLASLLGSDRQDFITRRMADGTEASFWLGGELKAGEKFHLWSDATSGLVEYQVRRAGGDALKKWSPLKKKKGSPSSAVETLGPGTYEIDFRVGKDIYSGIKLVLS